MMLAAAQLGHHDLLAGAGLARRARGGPPARGRPRADRRPEFLIHPIAFVVALAIVTVLHIVIGEMVPKNIAIAGPERTSLWLVPPLVAFLKVTRPVIVVLNWIANHVLQPVRRDAGGRARVGVHPAGDRRDALGVPRRGPARRLADPRLTQALSSAEHTVADVLIPLDRVTVLPPNPTVGAVEEAVARTGFSRFPVQAPDRTRRAPPPRAPTRMEPGTTPITAGTGDGDDRPRAGRRARGYLHVKDVLDLGDGDGDGASDDEAPTARCPSERVRALPGDLAVGAGGRGAGRPAARGLAPRPRGGRRRRHGRAWWPWRTSSRSTSARSATAPT